MERVIKFRALNIKTGEWVYGFFANDVEWGKHYIFNQTKIGAFYHLTKTQIIPGSVGQYIGRTDKEGKEIYEGDIVVHNGEHCVINFKDGAFGIDYCLTRNKWERILNSTSWEVIGNIHANPELIQS